MFLELASGASARERVACFSFVVLAPLSGSFFLYPLMLKGFILKDFFADDRPVRAAWIRDRGFDCGWKPLLRKRNFKSSTLTLLYFLIIA
jgi:hypothetical protein